MSRKSKGKEDNIITGPKKNKVVRNIVKTLKHRSMVIEKTLVDIQKVGSVLEQERNLILDSVEKTVEEIKETLDEVVENIRNKMEEMHDMNLHVLHETETFLMEKLETCKLDMAKCDDMLTDSVPTDELRVNKEKVLDTVMSSVERNKFTPPKMDLNRMSLDKESVDNEVRSNIKKLIGKFSHRRETLGEIKNPVTLLKSMPVTNLEVNAIAVNSVDGKTKPWICSGVSNEIINYSDYGVREKTISADFQVNDFVISHDSKIFATSPDSHHIRCLKLTKSGGFVQIFALKDELHLQGVALCRNKKAFVVCGTDRPNYSSTPPNEVVIIEYTCDGKELKRLAIRNFSGKVYRLAQNKNNNYVLTFPKEGKILSVDNATGEIKGSFDKADFRLFVSNYFKPAKGGGFWPTGVCCDANGNIFVTEYLEKITFMLDSDCTPIRMIGGRYACPNAVCFNETFNALWVADKGKIHVWRIENAFKVSETIVG